MGTGIGGRSGPVPLLSGLRPLERRQVPAEALAGLTLAAVAIPEVLGYARIAGMPVITGLYTILLPLAVFALVGSSRHLSVGADSATAAVLAAGLAPLALAGSPRWVALAGVLALLTGLLLLVARVARLGVLGEFLSRTVLVGFLTGVGVEVALGQVGPMLGLPATTGVTVAGHRVGGGLGRLVAGLGHLGSVSWATVGVSVAALAVVVGGTRLGRSFPGPLVAVVGAIVVSWHWHLAAHGVAVVGPVPSGLPHLGAPSVTWSQLPRLAGVTGSLFVLVLAQSAATARAYAERHEEDFDENGDLVGLGLANLAAGFSGTFVVNGSPTRTQVADRAGARSQLAQLVTVALVGVTLVALTGPLQYLPLSVLAAIVFLIGLGLVDLRGLAAIRAVRTDEFVVATLTALTVVGLGVEQGVVLAVVASVVAQLRRTARPPVAVLVPALDHAGWHGVAPTPEARTVPGMVVVRFAGTIYYANANYLTERVLAFVRPAPAAPLDWLCLDLEMVGDIDVTGAEAVRRIHEVLADRGVRFVIAEPIHQVRELLTRYGLTERLGGEGAVFPTVRSAVKAYRAESRGRP